MSVVIQILGLADGGDPFDLAGSYVKEYTPDGHEGRGDLVLTRHAGQAKRYASMAEATGELRRASTTHPTRADGKPNRPLSAFTVLMEPLDAFDG
jgi:hypothetical protein